MRDDGFHVVGDLDRIQPASTDNEVNVDTGEHPAKLKDKVATPGGTTVEGLLKLEDGKLRAVIISAVTEATQKARALIPT